MPLLMTKWPPPSSGDHPSTMLPSSSSLAHTALLTNSLSLCATQNTLLLLNDSVVASYSSVCPSNPSTDDFRISAGQTNRQRIPPPFGMMTLNPQFTGGLIMSASFACRFLRLMEIPKHFPLKNNNTTQHSSALPKPASRSFTWWRNIHWRWCMPMTHTNHNNNWKCAMPHRWMTQSVNRMILVWKLVES